MPLANHQDILTAIGALEGGDNQEVLDAIAGVKGDPLATVKAAIDLVYALGTTEGYSLADVKTWAEAARDTGLPTIRDVLAKLGTSGSTIEARIDALSDLIVTETTIQGLLDIAVGVLAGAEGATIDGVLDAIDLLPKELPAGGGVCAPLITPTTEPVYGDQVALAEALQIDAPMAGVLIDVVDLPGGVREYPVGDFSMIFRAGYLAFITPLGYVEQPQYLSFTKGIYMAKTCTEAIGVLIKPNQGQTGFVKPFTLPSA